MAEINTIPVEKSWRDLTDQELAVSNLTFQITEVNAQIGMKNPFDSSSSLPVKPADITSGMDVKDYEVEKTDHDANQFEAIQFEENNQERVSKLRNKLDALEDDKAIIENGGKNKEELVEQYAKAERERREKLEEKSKPKIVN